MKGVLTIAVGRRYRRMALNLARSLWRFNPEERLAIVTDDARAFSSLSGPVIFVPFEADLGVGTRQKLHMDYYTPFEQTLFLDADCLVFGSLQGIWEDCSGVEFGVFGVNITDLRSWWYFRDVSATFLAGVRQVPRFNGGLYYFRKRPSAEAVFALVRTLALDYQEAGLASFRQGVADEPLFALALGKLGLSAISNGNGQLATPDEFGFCPARADVFAGRMTYIKDGVGRQVTVAHFFGPWTGTYLYLMETLRLKFGTGILGILVALAVKALGDGLYSVFLFLRRVVLGWLRPGTETMPAGLLVIPLFCFTQKLRSAFRGGGRS